MENEKNKAIEKQSSFKTLKRVSGIIKNFDENNSDERLENLLRYLRTILNKEKVITKKI